MREYEIKPHLLKILQKLSKKDKVAYEAILKKIEEVISVEDMDHYKNLRYNLKNLKRVHVASSFVLVFEYDPASDFISFVDYDHHDVIYSK